MGKGLSTHKRYVLYIYLKTKTEFIWASSAFRINSFLQILKVGTNEKWVYEGGHQDGQCSHHGDGGPFVFISRPSPNNWAGVNGKKIGLKQDGRKSKRQKDIDHHDPKHIPNICHLPDPPTFLLVPTFKVNLKCIMYSCFGCRHGLHIWVLARITTI